MKKTNSKCPACHGHPIVRFGFMEPCKVCRCINDVSLLSADELKKRMVAAVKDEQLYRKQLLWVCGCYAVIFGGTIMYFIVKALLKLLPI